MCVQVGGRCLLEPLRKALSKAKSLSHSYALVEELTQLLESHERRVSIEERRMVLTEKPTAESSAKVGSEASSVDIRTAEVSV